MLKTWYLWTEKENKNGARTYKVTKIDGDYAHLLNVDTGEDLLMARALLPDETDEGTMLHWENFIYTVIE